MSDRFFVAERLRETSHLLALRGGQRFQAKAYARGAAAIEAVPEDRLATLLASGQLTDVPGVGPAIARAIGDIATCGTTPVLEELRAELPAGVVELAQVPGLGLPRARALAAALGLGTLDDLERACVEERVRTVKGFGPATEAKILRGVREVRERPQRVLLREAREVAGSLLRHLAGVASHAEVAVGGDVRRSVETADEVVVVAATDDVPRLLDVAATYPPLARIEEREGPQLIGRLAHGLRARVVATSSSGLALAWWRATGSAAHVAAVEARARARGVDLDRLAPPSEEAIYGAVGLGFVPPEMREGAGEIERAAGGAPIRLLEDGDLRGLVHCHTTWSDGKDTIEAMARKAEALGAGYITITDHSPAAHYAGGVPADRLAAQWDEIARVQELVSVRILRGTESDILEDGALDYPDAILEQLDVVIASIHSRMKMDAATMTERLIAAMRRPFFKIWGHPLGRLLLRRPPIDCDVERVLDVIAESRAAIEINGDPHRLDLEPRWVRAAHARGIRFVVSTDAHSTRGLETAELGVAMARRGGLGPDDVLNTTDEATFRRLVRPAG